MAAVRTALKNAAPNVPMAKAQTWGERFGARTAQSRLLMTILVFFGGLAGLLAAIGIYGLFSWSVALRTRELAIRLTLGARPFSVGNLVIRQSALLVVAGLVVGLVLIQLAESALTRVLYEVSPSDLGSTAIAGGVLLDRRARRLHSAGDSRDARRSGGGPARGITRGKRVSRGGAGCQSPRSRRSSDPHRGKLPPCSTCIGS